MARKSAPILEVSRLLDLVPYLSTHSHISLKELANEFGVSEKEMANELTSLSMCGLPGYTPYELIEIFFDSGFVTINNHDSLDIPRALSNLEVASLLIGLELLRDQIPGGDARTNEVLDNLLAQLRALSGSAIEIKPDLKTSASIEIQRAIESRRNLEIQYLSPVRDEITTRTISPVAIHSDGGLNYLSAYCYSSNGFRTFRLDRITSLQAIEGGGTSQAQPELGTRSETPTVQVRIKARKSKRAISELLRLENAPSDGEISLEVFSEEWVAKAAIAHSPDLVLLAPPELKSKIAQDLKNILALYSS